MTTHTTNLTTLPNRPVRVNQQTQDFDKAQEAFAASYAVSPAELLAVIRRAMAMRRPVFVQGPPGIGKSSVAQLAADIELARYIDLRAPLLDPVDVHGMPVPDMNTQTMRWLPPNFLPPTDSPDKWLINIEELPAAPPSVQTALYQLTLDRRIGDYKLPEGATVIACGNQYTDRGQYHRLPAALQSRFFNVDMEVSMVEWTQWALTHDVSPLVVLFIQHHPLLLHDYNPKDPGYAFPNPRGWEYVSDLIKSTGTGDELMDKKVERTMLRGAIGEKAAVQFLAFLAAGKDLPHPRVVLNDPQNCMVPASIDAQMVLCGSLVQYVDDMNFEAVVQYAKRLQMEVGQHLVTGVSAAILSCRTRSLTRSGVVRQLGEGVAIGRHHRVKEELVR